MPRRFAHHRLTFNPTVFGGLWLLVCVTSPGYAQYRFDHWTTEHGLPQNSINAITQTRDGYLWLATNDGLARFDGVQFTIFNHGNSPQLASNRLLSLYEDRQGTLWIGSAEGTLTRYREGEFQSYTSQDGLPEDQFKKIEEDAAGHLWLIGAARGNIVQWRKGRFLVYQAQDCLPGRIADERQHHQIWWSLDETGLHLLSRGRLLTFTQQDGLPSLEINAVVEDQHGTLWIDANGGLVRVKQGHQLTVFRWPNVPPPTRSGAPVGEDRKGNLWIFSSENAWRISGGTITFQPEIRGFGIAFYEDREGTAWIGTSEGLYRARELPIRTLTERPNDRYQLTAWIYSVLEDRNGDVWLGQWGGGLSRYHAGRFTHFVSGAAWLASLAKMKQRREEQLYDLVYEENLFSPRITSLYEDRAGVLWIGTDKGLCQFKDGKLTRYSSAQNLSEIWATYQDRAGDYWFAATTGLTRLHNGSFTTYTTRDGLPHNDARVIREDRRGRLWIGTYGGLARWEQGRFSAWTEPDGLAGKQIRCLYEDSDGALWIGTYDGGLTRLKDGRFTRYTTREWLFASSVFQILDDGRGYFWLSCNRGIFRVSQQQLNDLAEGRSNAIVSTAFDAKDGMLKAECNGGGQPAGWKLRNGQLWFPTTEGVAIIDPATLQINPLAPPLVIEECRLNREPASCRGELRIAPGQGNLEIQYTANSFIKPEQIRFKYKLAGVDADWVEAGNRRTAYYSYIPPGDYTFTVRAANSDGVWNEQGTSLRIRVVPSFWQTWWFTSLCLLTAIGSALLIYRRRHQRRIWQLQKEKAAQQAFTHQLIESQEQERQRIANNLHDSLSQDLMLIRNWAQQGAELLTEQAPGRQQLGEIAERSAHAIAEAKEIIYNLRPLQIEQVGLAGAIKIMFRKLSSSSGVAFTADLIECEDALSPEAKINLYRIVQEGANNVIKHASATQAHLTLELAGRQLALVLQDNGRGFDVAAVAANGTHGLGLASLAQRAQMLGGQLTIESQPGAGTTIILIITLPETPRGD